MKKERKYWYEFDHYECPLCSYTETYKNRVYGRPKPKEYKDRHFDHIHRTHFCDK